VDSVCVTCGAFGQKAVVSSAEQERGFAYVAVVSLSNAFWSPMTVMGRFSAELDLPLRGGDGSSGARARR